ncbi:MAG: serine kinase [Verrucomicrobiae bacterium]|nr:serine kinase [Verrucomicrobiae bacterium]
MKLADTLSRLDARVISGSPEVEVRGCYISDLLSDVLAHARPGALWVTLQTHRNVVSVAAMKDVAGVLITCGRQPDPAVVAKAAEEEVVLLSTPLTTFEAAGKLWELL